jgi:hypothetical protein
VPWKAAVLHQRRVRVRAGCWVLGASEAFGRRGWLAGRRHRTTDDASSQPIKPEQPRNAFAGIRYAPILATLAGMASGPWPRASDPNIPGTRLLRCSQSSGESHIMHALMLSSGESTFDFLDLLRDMQSARCRAVGRAFDPRSRMTAARADDRPSSGWTGTIVSTWSIAGRGWSMARQTTRHSAGVLGSSSVIVCGRAFASRDRIRHDAGGIPSHTRPCVDQQTRTHVKGRTRCLDSFIPGTERRPIRSEGCAGRNSRTAEQPSVGGRPWGRCPSSSGSPIRTTRSGSCA